MATAVPFGPLALSIEDFPGPAFVLEGRDGRVSAHNAAFAAWAGLADLAGLALTDILPGDPGAARLWHEARANGIAEHHVERRGRDGESSFWSLRARRTPAGVLVCATDLTALAAAAHAVHAAERDYVAVAAHELRAPLSAIKAWASALDARHKSADPAVAEGLGAIARQVDRMNELLTDLFDAARAGTGALCAERARVAVEALVQRAVAARPHEARVVVPPALPGYVFVDAAQIEAVIGRLMGWIVERHAAAPEAPILVDVADEGREIHVRITDPGPELTRRAEGELFARAVRARRGRGLGLYLCQQLAAANRGRVFRERAAAPGEGARFVLALPAAEGSHPTPQAPAEPGPARVLVADPDPARRALSLAALRLEGYEASGAPDAARCLEILDEDAWDVVVIDLLLPGLLGLVTIRRIEARPAPPRVVMIAPSVERPEALDGAERAGALAVLSRPVDWPHLVSLVGCVAAAR